MRKSILKGLAFGVVLLYAASAFAATTQVKTMASAKAVAQAATVYSSSLASDNLAGHVGLELISTAGSVTITQQVSLDNTTFYDPVDSDGNALGQVITAQTVTTGRYIVPDVVLAPYIRYKITETNVASTVVTIKLVTLND